MNRYEFVSDHPIIYGKSSFNYPAAGKGVVDGVGEVSLGFFFCLSNVKFLAKPLRPDSISYKMEYRNKA